jgi:hypothetical protein
MADFLNALYRDKDFFFTECFIGVIRILEADESSVDGGWQWALNLVDENYPTYKARFDMATKQQEKDALAKQLQKMRLAKFTYYDKKTNDTEMAWQLLEESQQLKLKYTGTDPQKEFRHQAGSQQVFTPQRMQMIDGKGSQSKTPIFVVGFPRSGTTLLERVLDAHPEIAGLGENSAIHGQINTIRDKMLRAIVAGDQETKVSLNAMADEVREKLLLFESDVLGASAKGMFVLNSHVHILGRTGFGSYALSMGCRQRKSQAVG